MITENEHLRTGLEGTTEDIPHTDRDSVVPDDTPTPDGSLLFESDADISWEHRLNTFKQRIEELQEKYDESYLEIGRVLIQARDLYKGHGDWIKWLKENVPFSVRHAQRLIRVAEMLKEDDTTLVSRLGLTSSKAYIFTRVSKNDLGHFLDAYFPVGDKKKLVKDMTKQELELVVTTFLKGKLASTDHEGVTTDQDNKTLKKRIVEVNLKELKRVLNKTIASIKGSDSDTRESWISELEKMCRTGLDELTPDSV